MYTKQKEKKMRKTGKKLLTVLLALTMVLCVGTSAFASVDTISDGEYKAEMATGEKMFKVVDCKLTVKDGKAQAEILLSGSSYYALVPGTEEEALADYNAKDESKWIKPDGEREYITQNGETKTGRVYTIPVESFDKPIHLVSVSEKYYNQGNTEKMFYPRTLILEGKYDIKADTGEKMFKVVNCSLSVKDGKLSAEVLLSSTGYYALFIGTKEEAAASYEAKDESKWIKPSGEKEYISESGETKTGRVYTIPLESIDNTVELISVSEKYYNQGNIEKMFYERSITMVEDTMKAISLDLIPVSDENTGNTGTENQGNNNDGQNNQTGGSENNTNTDKADALVPETGDNSNFASSFSLMVAAAVLSAVFMKKRKNA